MVERPLVSRCALPVRSDCDTYWGEDMSLPKPYYEDDVVTIYHADCRDILPELPKLDLVLTDPPYGIAYDPQSYNPLSYFTAVQGDDSQFDPRPFLDYPNVILWGANNYTRYLPKGGWLCWDKRVIDKADNMVGSPFELAWMKNHDKANIFRIARIQHGGVVNNDRFNGNPQANREHPTQKPIRLMEWCILLLPEVTLILDPFLGSGTTAFAAKKLGRKCIGIEIEERYCEIAAKRCSQMVMDLQDNHNVTPEQPRDAQGRFIGIGETSNTPTPVEAPTN